MKKIELQNQPTIMLKKFDLASIPNHTILCMIAKRNSGKSWVCRDILYHKRNVSGGTVISKTDKLNPFYSEFFPNLYIHYTYSPSVLENFLLRQKIMADKQKKKALEGIQLNIDAVLIMDDTMSSKNEWKKDPSISEIFMNGRHYKMMYLLTMQDALGLEPALRTNIDYVFLLADDFYTNQKRIFEHYAGMFRDFETFRKVFMECTADYCCMVINNNTKASNTIEDKVFWFKASPRQKFDFGCKQFRDFSISNYDPEYDSRPRLFNIADIQKKANLRVIKGN